MVEKEEKDINYFIFTFWKKKQTKFAKIHPKKVNTV
jgi:hypothetical protein